jgi:hypothetical protein
MLEIISEKIYSGLTYAVTFLGIWLNFDSIKSVILFIGALILLSLQIYLHILKIRKEKKQKTNYEK